MEHHTTDAWSNKHYLKTYDISVNSTHNSINIYTHDRRKELTISGTLTKPDGTLWKGPTLYAFAYLSAALHPHATTQPPLFTLHSDKSLP